MLRMVDDTLFFDGIYKRKHNNQSLFVRENLKSFIVIILALEEHFTLDLKPREFLSCGPSESDCKDTCYCIILEEFKLLFAFRF